MLVRYYQSQYIKCCFIKLDIHYHLLKFTIPSTYAISLLTLIYSLQLLKMYHLVYSFHVLWYNFIDKQL